MLLIPPGMTLMRFMQSGLHRPERIRAYLTWVESLPCSICAQAPPSVAHHLVGMGLKGVGGKVSDLLTMPLCAACHTWALDSIHELGHEQWEKRRGPQAQFVMLTLYQALIEGVLRG